MDGEASSSDTPAEVISPPVEGVSDFTDCNRSKRATVVS